MDALIAFQWIARAGTGPKSFELFCSHLSTLASRTPDSRAWLTQAAWTYPLCGVLAGLLSAVIWFRWRARDTERAGDDPGRN